MFEVFDTARSALEALVHDFDESALTPGEAVRAVNQASELRAMLDGVWARAAMRVEETSAHVARGGRNAAEFVARKSGVSTREVKAAIETANKLKELPVVDAAVRSGKLSAPQADLIAQAASENPAAESRLLDAAHDSMAKLRDACIAARAEVEDKTKRAERQRKQRSLRMWTDAEGMLAGSFRLTPEIGGQFKETIDKAVQRIFRKRRSGDDHEPLEAYAADALAKYVLGDDDDMPKGRDVRVHILIDHAALVRGGTIDGEVCEIPGVGPVDVAWVRELLGSAFLTAIIKKGKDIVTVAHLGRHVPAEIQTALLVSGRECDIA
ncbi:MAG: hypothetical protein ACHQY2_08155, partial [Candidatus Eremiobacterales bacterium]